MKHVHRIACMGVRLISISNNGVTFENEAKSYFVVEVKEKQDSYPIFLELKGVAHNKRGDFLPRER